MTAIEQRIATIAARRGPPSPSELVEDILPAVETLRTEPPEARPPDNAGRPGGIVRLRRDVPLVVIPDIHARVDLLTTVLGSEFPDHGIKKPLMAALRAEEAVLLMVGDYVHAEARARKRWQRAHDEYLWGYRRHDAIDAEMNESLGTLQIVALLKAAFPDRVHGLKGNHENIANEEGQGNHKFYKFADEGAMVALYMDRFYPGEATGAVFHFEKELPLLAIGPRCLVSHAEPLRAYDAEEIVNYRDNARVVEGLTWTDNGMSRPGSVAEMLRMYLAPQEPAPWEPRDAIYLGGHRPVLGRYNLRSDGLFVQFHNPERRIVAVPPAYRPFDPERDILEV